MTIFCRCGTYAEIRNGFAGVSLMAKAEERRNTWRRTSIAESFYRHRGNERDGVVPLTSRCARGRNSGCRKQRHARRGCRGGAGRRSSLIVIGPDDRVLIRVNQSDLDKAS